MSLEKIFQKLHSSIDSSICCSSAPGTGFEVFLKEDIKKGDKTPPTLNKLTIFGFDEVIAIDQDLVKTYSPLLLRGKKAMGKTCDGILLAVIKNKPCFLVIEMKSSLSNKNEHAWKMQAGKNMISYLKCVCFEYLDIDISTWPIFYCIFHIADPKRSTHEQIPISHDPKNPAYFIVNNNDRFSALKIINVPLI